MRAILQINFIGHANMSVVVAFNTLLGQFITELAETFPDDKKLFIYKTIIHEMCQGETMVGMQTFQDKLAPFADKIVARDDSMFDDCQPLFGRVDIGEIWKSHNFTEANKDIFWEYMHAMLDMCQQVFPPLPSTALMAAPPLEMPNNFDLASMLPAPMMKAASEMLQGVDMNDIMSLARDLDEGDVREVMESIDPSVLSSLATGSFNAETLTKLQNSIQPDRLLEIVGKFDKDKLAKLASQVDQDKLMDMIGPIKSASKSKSKSRRK